MFSYYCSIASTSFKPMSFVHLKLCLVKVVKSDVCEWRVFAEPVTYSRKFQLTACDSLVNFLCYTIHKSNQLVKTATNCRHV